MQATADSRTVNVIGIGIEILLNKGTIFVMALPNRDISRCPAIKFAVSRTHSVIGRMMLLTNSIKTMNIIKAPGVPCGNK
jgi:hypothetical protein